MCLLITINGQKIGSGAIQMKDKQWCEWAAEKASSPKGKAWPQVTTYCVNFRVDCP
jgi:hypothetical protein